MILATNNNDKTKQFKGLFAGYEIFSLKEKGIVIDIEENGKTFQENAIIKAKAIHELTGESVLADDSGICINELNDWPGVETHRFLGENATNEDRNNCILEKMKDLPREKRGCKIVCSLAFCDKKGNIYTTDGVLDRFIVETPRGDNKFGFDEIVEILPGLTAAELTTEEKNKISARSVATKKMKEILDNLDKNLI